MGFLDSKSFNETTTTNTVSNQHATAGADGFAVGAGSNVNIDEVSDEIAIAALDANETVSRDAFGLAEESQFRLSEFANASLEGYGDLQKSSLDAVSHVARNTLDTLAGQGKDILNFANTTLRDNKDLVEMQLETNNRFARDQSELIAAQAGVVAPTDNKRQQMLVAGALGLVGLIVLIPMFRSAKR